MRATRRDREGTVTMPRGTIAALLLSAVVLFFGDVPRGSEASAGTRRNSFSRPQLRRQNTMEQFKQVEGELEETWDTLRELVASSGLGDIGENPFPPTSPLPADIPEIPLYTSAPPQPAQVVLQDEPQKVSYVWPEPPKPVTSSPQEAYTLEGNSSSHRPARKQEIPPSTIAPPQPPQGVPQNQIDEDAFVWPDPPKLEEVSGPQVDSNDQPPAPVRPKSIQAPRVAPRKKASLPVNSDLEILLQRRRQQIEEAQLDNGPPRPSGLPPKPHTKGRPPLPPRNPATKLTSQ